jgi:predicted transcriptional regulator
MPTTSSTNLKLDYEVMKRVEQLAASRSSSSDSIMREAIEEYVSRAEKREQFRLDTLASWEEYQRTGLHLTEEEADEWLTKLAGGEDVPIPKCHD